MRYYLGAKQKDKAETRPAKGQGEARGEKHWEKVGWHQYNKIIWEVGSGMFFNPSGGTGNCRPLIPDETKA